jgi:[acyl-carrier-protein] S-malonyltransferase
MTLAFIVDGGLNDPPGNGADLYERFETVRRVYAEAAECAGMPVSRLLSWELPRQQEHRDAGAIRQAAITLALFDTLAEHGVRPGLVGGVSLGGMIASCASGAIERADLFGFLAYLRKAPEPSGPAQGVATLLTPPDADLADFTGERRAGVWFAADLGTVRPVGYRMFLLSGYRAALDELAAGLPEGTVKLHEDLSIAYHSPLSDYLAEYVRPAVEKIPFRDPDVPVCSYLEKKVVTTGEGVRDLFLRNQVEGVSLPYVFWGLRQLDTELGLLVGAAQAEMFVDALPFPIVHVASPDHLPEAFTAIHEVGVELPA